MVPADHLPDLTLIAGRPLKSTLPSRVNSSDSDSEPVSSLNLFYREFLKQTKIITFLVFTYLLHNLHSLLMRLICMLKICTPSLRSYL